MSKFTTIQDVERSGEFGGVYCMNITPATQRSQIVFTVAKLHGDGLDNVFIPATGFPIELTAQVTKRQLLNSSEFRRAVNQKHIQLVTSDYFNEMMAEEGSHEEVQSAMSEMTTTIDAVQGVSSAKAALEDQQDEVNRVHPQVELVVEQLNAGDLREMDALGKLRGLGDLNKRSFQHISKNTKSHARIQNWIVRVREEKFGE